VIKFIGHEKIPLDELELFPGNANIGNVPMIVESLIANSQFRPLVVRRTEGRNVIMAGNHTKLAMVEHGVGLCQRHEKYLSDQEHNDPCALCDGTGRKGFDGLPRCEIFECTDEDAVRVNVADNRISEFSKRDDEALAELLMELGDLTGSGYTADDLRLYLPQEVPDLDSLAEQYGDVTDEATPVLPVLSFRVQPEVRDRFLAVTEGADDPSDPVSRFTELLQLAEEQVGDE
jgi:hypothetical protein